MKSTQVSPILAQAITGAWATPMPKLQGEALERALAKLDAPEPWEKRSPQFMIDGYEEPSTAEKRDPQFMIDGYEEPAPEQN
ncbi:hypothetical protein GGS21DRAFT_532401 [Xylaria nigripes]|nr:hypothetical protein GGS21DRAFT_532401 [Xylaria nigripes]